MTGRDWFGLVHSVVAVPLWSWAYVYDGFWVFGLFALAHAVILGVGVERLATSR